MGRTTGPRLLVLFIHGWDNDTMTEHTQLIDALNVRITTRHYDPSPMAPGTIRQLSSTLNAINMLSGLDIQLVTGKPDVFEAGNTSGHLSNAANYLALVGPKDDPESMEKAGFYGQRLVLTATLYGLGTGWVAGSWNREAAQRHCRVTPSQALYLGITIGYSASEANYGNQEFDQLCRRQAEHRPSKSYDELTAPMSEDDREAAPDWFKAGLAAAAKAPSAMNGQPVLFTLDRKTGDAAASLDKNSETGSIIDLGIAKMNFQIGAGGGTWVWGDGGHFIRS